MPTRASARQTTRLSKEQLHEKMRADDARRAKFAAQADKKAKKLAESKKPPMTQEERLAEAVRVEKMNAKSLNRWEEAEKQREEERMRKIAALNSRKLDGPVVTFWSGIQELKGETGGSAVGMMVAMEEKAKKPRLTKKQREALEKEAQEKEAKEKAPAGGENGEGGQEKTAEGAGGAPVEGADNKTEKGEASSNGERPGVIVAIVPHVPPPKKALQPAPPGPVTPAPRPALAAPSGFMAPPPMSIPFLPPRPSGVLAAPHLMGPFGVGMFGPRDGAQAVLAPPSAAPNQAAPNQASAVPSSPVVPAPPKTPLDGVTTAVPTPAKAQEQPASAPPAGAKDAPLEGKVTRSCIILQNFDEDAIKHPQVQTQILFGRKMTKLAKPAHPSLCAITHHPAKYRDPKTGLPFASSYAYNEIQRLQRGDYKFSRLAGVWVGSGTFAAEGVPERFLDAEKAREMEKERKVRLEREAKEREVEEKEKRKREEEERKKREEEEQVKAEVEKKREEDDKKRREEEDKIRAEEDEKRKREEEAVKEKEDVGKTEGPSEPPDLPPKEGVVQEGETKEVEAPPPAPPPAPEVATEDGGKAQVVAEPSEERSLPTEEATQPSAPPASAEEAVPDVPV